MDKREAVCGEGDTPMLFTQKVGRGWRVYTAGGLLVCKADFAPTFLTKERAAAFCREFISVVSPETKTAMCSSETSAGRKLDPNWRVMAQAMVFIAQRHGAVAEWSVY